MDRSTASSSFRRPRVELTVFLLVELGCLATFLAALHLGLQDTAFVVLASPFLLLLLAWLSRSGLRPLFFFAAVFPLIGFELVPTFLRELFVFPGVLGLLLLFLLTGFLDTERQSAARLKPMERIPFQVFAAVLVISGLLSFFRGLNVQWTVKTTLWALEMLLVAWAFAVIPRSLREVRDLLYVMTAVFVASSCFFLLQGMASGGPLWRKVVEMSTGSLHMNVLGSLVGPFAAVLLGAVLGEKRGRIRVVLLVSTALLMTVLLFTRSRGAWLGFGIAFLYVLFNARSLGMLVFFGVTMTVMLLSDVLRTGLLSRIASTSAQDASLLGRLLLWKCGLGVAKENWLVGVGFENFRVAKYVYGLPRFLDPLNWYNTHSLYLEILADLGVLGLLSYLWFSASAFLRLNRFVRGPRKKVRGLALGLNAGIIAYAVHGFLDSLTYRPATIILPGLLVGLAIAVHRIASESDVPMETNAVSS